MSCAAVTLVGTRCRHSAVNAILQGQGLDMVVERGEYCYLHGSILHRRKYGYLSRRQATAELRRRSDRVKQSLWTLKKAGQKISRGRTLSGPVLRALRVLCEVDPEEWLFLHEPTMARHYRIVRR